MSIINLYNVK